MKKKLKLGKTTIMNLTQSQAELVMGGRKTFPTFEGRCTAGCTDGCTPTATALNCTQWNCTADCGPTVQCGSLETCVTTR